MFNPYCSITQNVQAMERQNKKPWKDEWRRVRRLAKQRLFSLHTPMSTSVHATVCLSQSRSLNLLLHVETVNTDASESLHKQRQNCAYTHTQNKERESSRQTMQTHDPQRNLTIRVILVCNAVRVGVFFGFGWCVHRLCKLVIKCKAVTKEWIQLKPLGLECKDKTFQRKNISRQKDRLKCHVNTWRRAYFRK